MVTAGHNLIIPVAGVAAAAVAGVGEGGVVRLAGGAVPARLPVLLAKVLLHLAVFALELRSQLNQVRKILNQLLVSLINVTGIREMI